MVFNLDQFLKGGGSMAKVPALKPGAMIVVPDQPQETGDAKSSWMHLDKSRSIYLMGQVASPGRYGFDPKMGFLDILTAAGGPGPNADLRKIRVSHRGEKGAHVETVNLSRYFATGDEELLPQLKTGDVIYLPDRGNDPFEQASDSTVQVMGSIARPGRFPFSDRMTLLDLLAEAGGPTSDAMHDHILVVNMGCCGTKAQSFDLVSFAKSGDLTKVPLVRAGDLVYVPSQGQGQLRQATELLNSVMPAMSGALILKALGVYK